MAKQSYYEQSVGLIKDGSLSDIGIAVESNKILAHLPRFVERSETLIEIVNAIASAINMFSYHQGLIGNALSSVPGTSGALDGMIEDLGLSREAHDNDVSVAIRVQNGIETHLSRGSKSGLEKEGGEITGVTPFVQQTRYILGVNPVGLGFGLGGVGTQWIQVWNDTVQTDSEMKSIISELLPIHVKIGLDVISAYGVSSGYFAVSGSDFIDGVYTVINTGFSYDRGLLIPDRYHQDLVYTLGNIDLAADYANYSWMADWVDYARWDVDYEFKYELRFSSDEISWGPWIEYHKNQYVAGGDLERYVQTRITVKINDAESLNHYAFSRFIMKGLTSEQFKYGQEAVVVESLNEIGT